MELVVASLASSCLFLFACPSLDGGLLNLSGGTFSSTQIIRNLAHFVGSHRLGRRQSALLTPRDQFQHFLARFIVATTMSEDLQTPQPTQGFIPGIRKLTPYWHPYTTMAKERWLGREILEVVSTEFRDRSMEYYKYALESGVTSINGRPAKPDTIIRNGDRIENVVHRHEPPITSTPVKIILHDKQRGFLVINKPGSIPVHATGRYYHHSLVQILRNDFGFDKVYSPSLPPPVSLSELSLSPALSVPIKRSID